MYPRLVLHQASGQTPSCLKGLVRYAQEASRHPRAAEFPSLQDFLTWCWQQPIKLDRGEGPSISGCDPPQRSRLWPHDGLNCWEATALFVAAALRHRARLEIHVYDALVNGQRHVFPALRSLGSTDKPQAVVLQHPVDNQHRAQAWYNDLLGGIHLVGDKALRIVDKVYLGGSGVGDGLADGMASVWGDNIPDWSRTESQNKQHQLQQQQQHHQQHQQRQLQGGVGFTKDAKARTQQAASASADRKARLQEQIQALQAELTTLEETPL